MRLKYDNWLLILFIAVFLFFGAGKGFDHRISHEVPTGMQASDAYTHNFVSQMAYDNGYFDKPPEYALEEGDTDEYKLFHPPILPILTASIVGFTNLNVYDVNVILVLCLIAIIVLLNYFIIKRFSSALALFSLPLSLLFIQRRFFISLTWGWWDFIIGEMFLFAIILLLLNKRFRYRYVFNAILITAAFMAHGVEAVYAAFFIGIYFLYVLAFVRTDAKEFVVEQLKSLVLVLLIGGYSVNVFLKTMGALGYAQYKMMSYSDFLANYAANYYIYFSEFVNFRILIVLGLVILAYLLWKKKKDLIVYYVFVVFMSLTPHLYFTAGERGFQWRFLWPIYLSIALGAVCFGIYLLVKKYANNTKYYIFGIYLIIMIFLLYPVQFEGNGLIAPEEFSAYKWMHENTDEKADVLIMFSPTNSQISKLYLIKRDLFVTKADQGVDDFRPISFYCKKEDCSLFKESRFLERRKELPRSLEFCDYEYVFIPLINYQEYSDANLAFAQGLVDINISTVVFNNPAVVILDVKDECENLI